jgi:tetratricopeptide (TPR) repeat protein
VTIAFFATPVRMSPALLLISAIVAFQVFYAPAMRFLDQYYRWRFSDCEGQVIRLEFDRKISTSECFAAQERIWRDELNLPEFSPLQAAFHSISERKLGELLLAEAMYFGVTPSSEIEVLYSGFCSKDPTTTIDLANLYVARGRRKEAELIYKEAYANMKARKSADWECQMDLDNVLGPLEDLYESQHRYTDSEALLRDALAFSVNRRMQFAPQYFLEQLAVLYSKHGRLTKAKESFNEALRSLLLASTAQGDAHLIARLRSGLGRVDHRLGRCADAEANLKASIMLFQQNGGDSAEYSGPAMIDLGQLYLADKRYVDAEPLLKLALRLNELELHKDLSISDRKIRLHDYEASANSLAEVYQAQGRNAAAQAVLVDACRVTKAMTG